MYKFFGEQDIIDDSFNEKFSISQNLFRDLAEKNWQRNTMFESNPLLQYQNDFNNNIEQSNTYSLFSINIPSNKKPSIPSIIIRSMDRLKQLKKEEEKK